MAACPKGIPLSLPTPRCSPPARTRTLLPRSLPGCRRLPREQSCQRHPSRLRQRECLLPAIQWMMYHKWLLQRRQLSGSRMR